MEIDFSIKNNYQSVKLEQSNTTLFVESFDNLHFDICLVCEDNVYFLDSIVAKTDDKLNGVVLSFINYIELLYDENHEFVEA